MKKKDFYHSKKNILLRVQFVWQNKKIGNTRKKVSEAFFLGIIVKKLFCLDSNPSVKQRF